MNDIWKHGKWLVQALHIVQRVSQDHRATVRFIALIAVIALAVVAIVLSLGV